MIPSPRRSALSLQFSERHELFRARVRGVVESFLPLVDEWERTGHLDRSLFVELARAGCFTERWEEGRVDGLPYSIVLAEELALMSGGVGLGVTLHSEIFLGALSRLATSDSQLETLEAARCGDAVGCLASTEPSGGSDLLGLRTTIERCAEGWRLRGEKRYTSNAGVATHALVLAHEPSLPRGRSITLVLVPLDAPGVDLVGFFPKLGIHCCDAAHLRFDALLPEDAVLGRPGTGMFYASPLLQHERITICAGLLAIARASVSLAVAFARARQIDAQRLIDKQALRHRLADARTALWAGEALLSSVVKAYAEGHDVSHMTAAAKLYCANAVGAIVDDCLQMFGGRGYTANYPLERFWRDARLARIGGGADEVMREVIADSLDRADDRFDALLDELAEHDFGLADHPLGQEA